MKTLILTQTEVTALLPIDRVIEAVEAAFLAHARGRVSMPAKVYLDLPEHQGDFRAMPACLEGVAGVKWVNSHPGNPHLHGLPAVMGLYILSDPATAAPLAVMDATLLTALRTGAAGAVASRYLAVNAPRSLGLIGAGVQARVLIAAHRVLYPGLELRVADLFPEAAARLAAACGGTTATVEQAAACDIVCTSTPSRSPVVQREWVRPGTHINAMGADAPGKQELATSLLVAARLVIDDPAQAMHSGEINVPLHQGALDETSIHATLGEIVAGRKAGRDGDEITVFDSTGLAIQDLALAQLAYQQARERGIGREVEFIPT
jgi:ornithine cyclodeaminase/alanine dehydrogenase